MTDPAPDPMEVIARNATRYGAASYRLGCISATSAPKVRRERISAYNDLIQHVADLAVRATTAERALDEAKARVAVLEEALRACAGFRIASIEKVHRARAALGESER